MSYIGNHRFFIVSSPETISTAQKSDADFAIPFKSSLPSLRRAVVVAKPSPYPELDKDQNVHQVDQYPDVSLGDSVYFVDKSEPLNEIDPGIFALHEDYVIAFKNSKQDEEELAR